MITNIRLSTCLGTCFLALTTSAHAQVTQLLTIDGEGAGDDLGYSVSPAGDVDNDGFGDFIVGAPELDQSFGRGYAQVISGGTGQVIRHFSGTAFLAAYGHDVTGVGDVDGDGYDDVAVGSPNDYASGGSSNARGSVRVYSGATGGELFAFWADDLGDGLGYVVGRAGDVNGDGTPDVIAGAIFDDDSGDNAGMARVYSGADGSILHTLRGEGAGDGFGVTVATAGDVNADGKDDLIVGSSAGYAQVRSGANGNLLYRLSGPVEHSFATAVADAGDVNLDGHDDFLIGSMQDDTVAGGAGMAVLYSGATGQELYSWYGADTFDLLGRSVACAGDVNGDSHPDVIVGALGYAMIYSGANGEQLYEVIGTSPFNGFGRAVGSAGDVDGDGYDEFVVGVPTDDANGSLTGAAYLFDPVISGGATLYCTPEANSTGQVAHISITGTVNVSNNDMRLEVHGAAPLTTGLFFYGSQRANVPFGDGNMCVGGSLFRLNPGVELSSLGFGSRPADFNRFPMNTGDGQIQAGDTWNFQFWYRDLQSTGARFNFSDALEITFLP